MTPVPTKYSISGGTEESLASVVTPNAKFVELQQLQSRMVGMSAYREVGNGVKV